jgi:hypothetical protein
MLFFRREIVLTLTFFLASAAGRPCFGQASSSALIKNDRSPKNPAAAPALTEKRLARQLTAWAAAQQRRALQAGVPLTPAQIETARKVGVRSPEKVRILLVGQVPDPGIGAGARGANEKDWATGDVVGLTLGHAVFLRLEAASDPSLLAHELTHVRQYERLGGLKPFLRRYLHEVIQNGYRYAPLEMEAASVELSFNRLSDTPR